MSARPVYKVLAENYTEFCTLPTPAEDGVKFTPERIWSQNAGRSSTTGLFVGDVIAVKRTVTISYASLTEPEVQTLLSLTDTSTPFWILDFPYGAHQRRIHCYVAPVTYTVRRWCPERKMYLYSDVMLEFIER